MSASPDNFSLHHEIFVLDAYLENELPAVGYKKFVEHFVQQLLHALDMKVLGALQIHEATDARAPGWSFIQPITTSHISGHYFVKPGRLPNIHVDIYSCRSVDWKTIVEILHEHLSLAEWRATFIRREMEYDRDRSILELEGKGPSISHKNTLLRSLAYS